VTKLENMGMCWNLVDKEVSKTSGRKSVWVRLPPSPLGDSS